MARTPLYSRSPQRPADLPAAGVAPPADGAAGTGASVRGAQAQAADARSVIRTPTQATHDPDTTTPGTRYGWRQQLTQRLARHERWAWATAMLLLLALVAGWPAWTARVAPPPSLKQIDAALRESLVKQPLPSAAAAAYEAILPSVVRVVGEMAAPGNKPGVPRKDSGRAGMPRDHVHEDEGRSVGTGVVIVDKGLILTNLHVVEGAQRITVTFADGTDSEAVVVNVQRDQDLAVLQAKTIPDDLHAATLRSTAGLAPGDEVLAVGFPFGIGPSASSGIVSGLKREFRSPEGKRSLSNLIQFDAAANPGNSGGPLVTLDGHVVGIVTAIMNPNAQRTFIGIGFAVPIEAAAGAVGMHPF